MQGELGSEMFTTHNIKDKRQILHLLWIYKMLRILIYHFIITVSTGYISVHASQPV